MATSRGTEIGGWLAASGHESLAVVLPQFGARRRQGATDGLERRSRLNRRAKLDSVHKGTYD